MAKTKPTVVPVWIPDNATNIVDPGSKATSGYVDEILPSSYLNYHLNRVGQWMQHLNKMAAINNYYVNSGSGSDTTGTGTGLLPWATIDKALSECPANSISIINFTDTGPAMANYFIQNHTSLENQVIVFLDAGFTTIYHDIDSSGASNEILGFDMYSSAVISDTPIYVNNPSAAKNWSPVYNAPYRAQAGKNYFISSDVCRMNTTAANDTTAYWATTSAYGSIDIYLNKTSGIQYYSQSNGGAIQNYLKNLCLGGEVLSAYQGDSAIDDTDYWIRTQTSVKPTYYFDFKKNAAYSSGLRRAAAGGPESITPKAIRGLPFDGSVCTADENNAAWATGIEAAASNFQSSSSAPAKVGKIMNITCTQAVSGNFIEGLTVEIDSGGLTGSVYEKEGRGLNMDIPFYLYVAYFGGADTCNFFPYMISKGERNPGLTTNVESLK
jgi:hypothetical protein